MNNTVPTQSTRYYDFDAMRSVLMTLGIVLHSANVFSPNEWAIQNTDTSQLYQYIVDFIHLFRMPAFFIVSGFFVHFTYARQGYPIFMSQRIPRIIIPLVVTAVTLNSLQYMVLHSGTALLSSQYWVAGKWVSHLWFLNALIYYFLGAYLVMRLLGEYLPLVTRLINTTARYSYGMYIIVLPIFSMFFLKVAYLVPESNSVYDLSLGETFKYAIYFLFGIAMGASKTIQQQFRSLGTISILSLISLTAYFASGRIENTSIQNILMAYAEHSVIWLACSITFYLFHKYLNIKTRFFGYMANASYSIYLFHHIFVILIGMALIPLAIPTFIKFLILVISTFLITNAIHYFVISRYNLMSFLFNGKRLPQQA